MFWHAETVASRAFPPVVGAGGGLLAMMNDGLPASPEGWGMLGVAVVALTVLAVGVLRVLEAAIQKLSANGKKKLSDSDTNPITILRDIRDGVSRVGRSLDGLDNDVVRVRDSLRDPYDDNLRIGAAIHRNHQEVMTAIASMSAATQDLAVEVRHAAASQCPVKADKKLKKLLDSIEEG